MKDNILIISFLTILFGFFVASVLLEDRDISLSERRKLASFPEIKTGSQWNEDYFQELDQYLIDQFPLRDEFRKMKAYTQAYLFNKKDNDGVFQQNGYIFELDQTLKESNLTYFSEKLTELKEKYLDDTNAIYYSIIPDKIYYLQDSIYPKLDYDKLITTLKEKLPQEFNYIDLFSQLELDFYYKTDIHWRQEKIGAIAKYLVESMHHNYYDSPKTSVFYRDFHGSLYSKLGLDISTEELIYLTNPTLEKITMWNYEQQSFEKLYQTEKSNDVDPYDVFLSGATPLLSIENPMSQTDRNLIIFRDSFTSSLTPLLVESYNKVTLIDLRYIATDLLEDKVDFKNSDILFLYSVPVINNSRILK